jgi:cbb3-type cytochrome oxidase subunit 3
MLSAMGMDHFALAALLVFFGSFVAIVIWVWTRPRHEMDARARLPVDDDPNDVSR